MSDRSAIEWTDATWNPIRARVKEKIGPKAKNALGWHCEHVSPGCEHCYAETMNKRLGTGLPFKPGHRADIEIFLDEEMLLAPLRWKRPRKIFVGSMTDLFADFVEDRMIYDCLGVMAETPEHTYQLLTKRPARMRELLTHWSQHSALSRALPNVWLGVSCERQEEADERIPLLLQTPAAVRFISAEPLLGPIDLCDLAVSRGANGEHHIDALHCEDAAADCGDFGTTTLDWIIVGGESGPNARPMSIQWARELRDQCAAANVAFFFKQWGEWAPAGSQPSGARGRFAFGDYEHDRRAMIQCDGYPRQFTKFGARSTMQRVGKKAAGRLLDGTEWNQFPKTEPTSVIEGSAPQQSPSSPDPENREAS
jgi:protein gp37